MWAPRTADLEAFLMSGRRLLALWILLINGACAAFFMGPWGWDVVHGSTRAGSKGAWVVGIVCGLGILLEFRRHSLAGPINVGLFVGICLWMSLVGIKSALGTSALLLFVALPAAVIACIDGTIYWFLWRSRREDV